MPHTFTGDLVVYVLDHEDKGMMMVVEMVDKREYFDHGSRIFIRVFRVNCC